jgi:MFS transporter, YNFM family, putative membrane transport protein
VWTAFRSASPMRMAAGGSHFWSAWTRHLADPRLGRAFAIGFLILFGFIGVFTYVGFVLTTPPIALDAARTALVFFCFAPSLLTTPLAGGAARRWGAHRVVPVALLLSVGGLAPLLLPSAWAVFAGLVLVSGGTFFAQAIATGYVGLTAESDRAAASGLYLAAYYTGGLAGAAIVGQLFDRAGWSAALAGVAAALTVAAWLGRGLTAREASNR